MYKDQAYKLLLERFRGERRFIQVLSGPRETGKTTLFCPKHPTMQEEQQDSP